MSILGELSAFNAGTWVELYEIDLTKFGQPIFRFHNGVNEKYEPVVWQGNTYQPFPAQVSGFEVSGQGFARPKVVVANHTGIITAALKSYNQLLGCKFTRKRTMMQYLDAVNFVSGNPTADNTQQLPPDVFFIAQKTKEDKYTVEFELASAVDLQGVMIPKRQVISNLCPFKYRGEECGYIGGAVADVNDNPTTNSLLDDCSRTVTGCKYRFGETGELSFGGFIGSSLVKVG